MQYNTPTAKYIPKEVICMAYWNCVDLRTLNANQRIELANSLKLAIASNKGDALNDFRSNNLAIVRSWLRHYDGIIV